MAPLFDVKTAAEAVVSEVTVVVNTLKEKGAKRFQRALTVSGGVVVGAYFLLYLPPQQKTARLQADIGKAKMLADNGAKFRDLRDQLDLAYAGLPALEAREQWLSNSVRDSLLAGGLDPENFTPVKEIESSGLIFQNSTVSLRLRFSEFYDWLLRVENAKPMMSVQSVELAKSGTKLGFNAATCDVATVIPKKRFR